jgi:hypothetical protein
MAEGSAADLIGRLVAAIYTRFRQFEIDLLIERDEVHTYVTFAGISDDALLAQRGAELEQIYAAAGFSGMVVTYIGGKQIYVAAALPESGPQPQRPRGRMLDMG